MSTFSLDEKPKFKFNLLSMLMVCLYLNACAWGVSSSFQPPAIYYIDANLVGSETKTLRSPDTIAVATPRARPGFDTRMIRYQQEAHRLEHYNRSEWAARPTEMLSPLLLRALEQSNYFETVVQAPSNVATDYRLETELVRLLHIFEGSGSYIHLVLRVQMLDLKNSHILSTQVIEIKKVSPSNDAKGGVEATNQAILEALKRVNIFCQESILKQAKTS